MATTIDESMSSVNPRQKLEITAETVDRLLKQDRLASIEACAPISQGSTNVMCWDLIVDSSELSALVDAYLRSVRVEHRRRSFRISRTDFAFCVEKALHLGMRIGIEGARTTYGGSDER